MPLTNTAIRNTKAGKKTLKLYDERGLYLEVSQNGGRWRPPNGLWETADKSSVMPWPLDEQLTSLSAGR